MLFEKENEFPRRIWVSGVYISSSNWWVLTMTSLTCILTNLSRAKDLTLL